MDIQPRLKAFPELMILDDRGYKGCRHDEAREMNAASKRKTTKAGDLRTRERRARRVLFMHQDEGTAGCLLGQIRSYGYFKGVSV